KREIRQLFQTLPRVISRFHFATVFRIHTAWLDNPICGYQTIGNWLELLAPCCGRNHLVESAFLILLTGVLKFLLTKNQSLISNDLKTFQRYASWYFEQG